MHRSLLEVQRSSRNVTHPQAPSTTATGSSKRRTQSSASDAAGPSRISTSEYAPRVLLVDDNHVNQKVLLALLRRASEHTGVAMVTTTAKNGREAVDTFVAQYEEKSGFHLVLMDCQMPVMDGYEATRHIRNFELMRDGASETPIVAVTANAMEEQVLECSAAGMDEVLTKPFKLGQLIDILRRHLPHLKEQKFKT
mgnify:FL=1